MLKPLLDNINCYQNDEQRVQQTAHFFCTRLFEEFGIDRKPNITELPLLSSVDQRARAIMDMEKKIINKILTVDKDYLKEKLDDLPEDVKRLIENIEPSYLEDLENPFKTLNELLLVINKILEFYKEKLAEEPFTEEQARMINQTVGRLEATLE